MSTLLDSLIDAREAKMPRKFSDAFRVPAQALIGEGALDAFVDIDSRFYIDPHLLQQASTPELVGSYQRFTQHFEGIIHLLDASQRKGDRLFREAVKKLIFRELPFVSLGYSLRSSAGSGIGPKTARNLACTASEIVKAGIKDPVIFELVGLFEEGIGADRVSDMTIRIILPDLLDFSERVAHNLSIQSRKVSFGGSSFDLPVDQITRRPVILVPMEILRHLPVAYDWGDIDYVCAHNAQLRRRVNRLVGDTWRAATRKRKRDIKDAILANPELLQDLIDQYKAKPARQYDFERDPVGGLIWHDIATRFAQEFPLSLHEFTKPDQIVEVVTAICEHFKRLVEFNGLNRLLYDDDRHLRHERFAQLLFFGIADAYCEANDLDLSREPNAGRGPVDFKFSRGYTARVVVEVKYTSNTHLQSGYSSQLPAYNGAERSYHSIYLVIRTTRSSAGVASLRALRQQIVSQGSSAPDLIVVDGRLRPSASKLRSRGLHI